MFSKIALLFLFAVASNLIRAEDADAQEPITNEEAKASFLSSFPFFSEFSSLLQGFPGFGSGTRQTRSAEEADDDDDEQGDGHQSRLFFGLFPTVTSCNYTANPGRSCPSCSQALTCLSNNVGILRTCRGLFRNCNGGRCSFRQSSACANSTSG